MLRAVGTSLVLAGCAIISSVFYASRAEAACNVTDFTAEPDIPNFNYYTPRPYSLAPDPNGLWDCFGNCGDGSQIRVIDDPAGGGNQVVQITGGTFTTTNPNSDDIVTRRSITPCVACGDGTFTITLRVKSGSAGTSNMWQISFGTGAQTHARLQGTATGVFGKAGANRITTAATLTSTFATIVMHVDTVTRTTEYYFNGTLLGVLNHDVDGAGGQKIDRFEITRLNNSGAAGNTVMLDDISIESCRTCQTNVTPKLAKDVTNVTGPFIPSSIVYTIQNYGSTSVNYTAQEVTANGTPFNYPWMDITSGASGSLPATGNNANVIVSNFSTTGTSPGLNVGYIKFTDTCGGILSSYIRQVNLWVGIPAACAYENFDALNTGGLSGQNGWSTTDGAGAGVVDVVSPGNGGAGKAAQLTLGGASGTSHVTRTFSCPSCADSGIIIATVKVKGNAGNTGGASNAWRFWVTASNGVDYGRWQGTAGNTVSGRIGGTNALTSGANINTGSFSDLTMVIDTINYTTEFFVDNVSKGKISNNTEIAAQGTPTNIGGSVTIERINRSDVSGTITFDDIQVITCPTCGIRVFPDPSGGSQAGRQNYNNFSGAVVGGVPDIFAWDWEIVNAGSTPLTFTVQESDINGNPTNYSWIDLDYASRPLNPEGTELDVAHINTTGLVPGEYIGYLKFSDNCSNTYTLRELKLIVIESTDQHTCLIDSFSLPNGNLNTHVGWSGTAGLSTSVLSQALKISTNTAGSTGGDLVAQTDVPDACVTTCTNLTSIISAKLKAKAGSGASNIVKIPFLDDAGQQMAMFQLTGTSVIGRINSTVTNPVTLTGPGTFDQLEARINTSETMTVGGIPPNSTQFLFNGVPFPGTNPISHAGASDVLAQVQANRVNSIPLDGSFVVIDDVNVTYCVPTCNDPVFDVRNQSNNTAQDGHVDDHDFAVFQMCATGSAPPPGTFDALSFECKCMDTNHDLAIDLNDFGVFQRCYSGPSLNADPNCDN